MLTFEKAMQLTRTIGSHTSFEDEECEAYYDVLMSLEPHSLIVEIGLEYGRSSSVALQVCKERELFYFGIEPDLKMEWDRMARAALGSQKYYVAPYTSNLVAQFGIAKFPELKAIDSILIDGDHAYDGVNKDLHHFVPLIPSGGYLLCHDYERDSLPEVHEAVNDYMRLHTEFYKFRQAVSLGIWRRM